MSSAIGQIPRGISQLPDDQRVQDPPQKGSLGGRSLAKAEPQLKLGGSVSSEAARPLAQRRVSLSGASSHGTTSSASAAAPAPQQQQAAGPAKSFSSDIRSRVLTEKELIAEMGKKPAFNRRKFLFFGKITWQSNYRQTVNELKAYQADVAKLKISKDPATRQLQLQGLQAQLDQIKSKADNYLAAGHSTKHSQVMTQLKTLVDQESTMLGRIASDGAYNADEFSMTWSQALEFGRAGLPHSDHTQVGAYHDGNVQKAKKLGAGAFNTVFKVNYGGVAEPKVIKQLTAEEAGSRGAVASETGIPRQNPRYGARNIATSILNEKLGLSVVPKASYGFHNERLAVVMDLAPGRTSEEAGLKYGFKRLLTNPQVQQKVNDLEWLDALTGQGDRHGGNYHIDIAKGGVVTVKGVDNDQCLGKNLKDPDQSIKHSSGSKAGKICGHNVGLPSLISRQLANTIKGLDFARDIAPEMGELLTPEEIGALKDRFDHIQTKVLALEASGHVVDDFATWKAPGSGKGVVDHLREQPAREGRHRPTPPSYLLRDFDHDWRPPAGSGQASPEGSTDVRLRAINQVLGV